jgi:hypothetical protein
MASIKWQRTYVKFCVKLGKQLKATHKTLCEAYGKEALSKMMSCEWHKKTSKAEEFQEMTMTMADQHTFNFKKQVFDCPSEKSTITVWEAA